jgi:anthranilate synthase component 2
MILLIDNYDSFTYNLYQMFAQLAEDTCVKRNDEITIADIKLMQPSAIILSPGPGKPSTAGICIDVIREFTGRIPILGICLGHQAIAEALGGHVGHAEKIMHGKQSLIFHSQQDLYRGLPLPFYAGRYHSLIVDEKTLPPMLKIQAKSHDSLIMGIRHQQHLTFGVQFHPESILTQEGSVLVTNFLELANLGSAL